MRRYKAGVNRQQSNLFPTCLDDYIDDQNPVRAIDCYVDSLERRFKNQLHHLV